jgi:PhzF family phenazine biosynthesis protein
MSLPIWQVDAFTGEPFKGNPAAVCVHQAPLSDALMQHIATEMNLSETAFVQMREAEKPLLRWFTPTREIDLCGHATLSAAHIMWEEGLLQEKQITFNTRFVGPLSVRKQAAGRYTLNFPTRAGEEVAPSDVPPLVLEGLGVHAPVIAVRKARDLMLVFDDAAMIRTLAPDFTKLRAYPDYLIVTAPSDNPEYDFISRFFCADDGITEDPVTGSAHCTLAPYWAEKLRKNTLSAYQASARGGVLQLKAQGEQVQISGQAVTIMKGELRL